jgi:hypothetical protein
MNTIKTNPKVELRNEPWFLTVEQVMTFLPVDSNVDTPAADKNEAPTTPPPRENLTNSCPAEALDTATALNANAAAKHNSTIRIHFISTAP